MKSALQRKLPAILSAAIGLSALGLTGCVYERPRREVVYVQESPPPQQETVVVADAEPPADQDETVYIVDAPYPDAIWIGGHYVWRDGRWWWSRGYWGRPAYHGAVWVRGHYYHRGYVEGHWR